MAKKAKPRRGDGLVAPGETGKMDVEKRADEKIGRTLARITLDPQTRNANLAMSFGSQMFGDRLKPDISESSSVLAEEIQRAITGDLSLASRIYTSHAISLDAIFTEMAGRSGNNMGQYPDAADRYMRMALKAQASCRTTLEALARLHQPREQTVKHVHVNDGGQAVVADHFHQHMGGAEKWKISQTIRCNQPGWAKRRAVWPGRARERSANLRQCEENGGAGCTAGLIPAHR